MANGVEVGDLPTWIAAILSIAAIAISIVTSARAERIAMRSQQFGEEVKAAEDRWQRDQDQHGSIAERSRVTMEWGGKVLAVVAQMHQEIQARGDECPKPAATTHLSATLSGLVDEGRLLFPNEEHETYGVTKSPAFRGIRQQILDDVVYMHDVYRFGRLFDAPAGDHEFTEIRRDFVSELQAKVNPERLTIERMKAYREAQVNSSDLYRKAQRSGEAER